MKRTDQLSQVRFYLIALVLMCCAARANGQTTSTDPRIGQKIIVTTAGAELKTPQAIVWRASSGEVFTVSLVNNEWLWIQEKGGWMSEKDGVLFDEAISVTSDRLSKSSTAEAYHVRGVVFVAHEQYDRALSDFSSSLKKSPRNAGVLNNRGQCHYLLEDYEVAIADFSTAIKIDSKHFVAFNNRASAHITQESYPAALSDIQKALQLNPKYPEAMLNRGVVYEKTGKSNQAIGDYTAALKIDAKYAAAYGNRAFSYRTLGRYSEALTDLRKAIELDPTNFEPVNDLAFTLATAKDDGIRNGAEALVQAERAIGMTNKEHWNTLDTLAVAQAAINDFDAAANAIAKAIELAPEKEHTKLKAHQELIAAGMPVLE
jgi:tetratricopeptide (TPR) repeat protein